MILKIGIEQHSMIPFLLRLNHVPVGEAIKSLGFEIIRKLQIEICGVELLVDLLIQQLMYRFVHYGFPPVFYDFESLIE